MTTSPVIGNRRRVAGAVLLALSLSWAWTFAATVAVAQSPKPNTPSAKDFPISFGGPFSLIDHEGQARSDRDFGGRYVLIYFGYTQCPEICPTGLQTIGAALDLVGEAAAKVQPIFISVDPDRDRPDVLKRYISQFHPRLIGLTGSENQVREAARAYHIYRGKVVLPDTPKSDYLVTHTPTTFLMGPDGKFVTLFPYDTDAEVMAKALRRYLSGGAS